MLRQAAAGAVIELPPGDYRHERLEITRPVTLRAVDGNRWAVRIHTETLRVAAPDVRLESLTLLGSASYAPDGNRDQTVDLLLAEGADRLAVVGCTLRTSRGNGARVRSSAGLRIEHCLIADNAHAGLILDRVEDAAIRGNVLSNNVWFGIEARATTDSRFEGNQIGGSGWTGIWCHTDSTGNVVADNSVENADAGLTISSSGNRVSQNRLRGNTVGIHLGAGPFHRSARETGGAADDDVSTGGVTVRENLITDGGQVGILVRRGTGHEIARNTIYDVQRSGIVIQEASRGSRVEGNTIARCGLWGVLVGQCSGTLVQGNRVADCRAGVRLVESPESRVGALDTARVEAVVVADRASRKASRLSRVRVTADHRLRQADGEEHRWLGYRALFGDFHVHSEMSDGAGSLEAMYRYARDAVGLDFMAASDHSDYALLRNGPTWWADQAATVERLDAPGVFSAFPGQEVTYRHREFGHWNVYYAEDTGRSYPIRTREEAPRLDEPRRTGSTAELQRAADPRLSADAGTPERLLDTVERLGGDCFVILHHYYFAPGFWQRSPRSEEHLLATEICSRHGIWAASGGPSRVRLSPEQITTLEDGLAAGWKLAVIGGSDSHYGTAGTRALAGVWATENSRAAIRAALLARRTFATTGARIALELSADGHPMGAEYLATGAPALAARAASPGGQAGRLRLLRGGEVIDEASGSGTLTLETTDGGFQGATHYRAHYLRGDGEQAWSTPIWVGRSA